MARNTGLKIDEAALGLFAQQWFETVSIAEICRKADVSNGVFYRYYSNKDQLVQKLLDDFLSHFEEELLYIEGDSVEERLMDLVRRIYRSGETHSREVTVFREGQYRFPEYEQRLRSIYIRCCETVYQRSISEVEYLYIISGLRFLSTRAIYDQLPRDPELVGRFIIDGVFAAANDEEKALERLSIPEEFARIEDVIPGDSREKLLFSGMKLIGSRGYHEIGVADIVRDSGLAVGTFYTYFDSKEQFFSLIIELIGQKTRRYLRDQAQTHKGRLEQEIYGIWHFLSYFNRHPEYYRIVREAEFVGKPWVRRYYDAFETGYMHNLELFEDLKIRRIAANFLMGISHYMGIEALLNKRIQDIPGAIGELAQLMCKGVAR